MSRADLMLSVLEDGRPHSRRDIQRRVGYFLTNNAASELRKRGLNVVYRRNSYQLVSLSGAPPSPQDVSTSQGAPLSEAIAGSTPTAASLKAPDNSPEGSGAQLLLEVA